MNGRGGMHPSISPALVTVQTGPVTIAAVRPQALFYLHSLNQYSTLSAHLSHYYEPVAIFMFNTVQTSLCECQAAASVLVSYLIYGSLRH